MNLNQTVLVGRLGKDPEIRYLASGQAMCKFSLATSEKYKRDGEEKESTAWHNIVVWGSLGEAADESFTKGNEVIVIGKTNTRSWEDKDGNKRTTTEVTATHIGPSLQRKSESEQKPRTDTKTAQRTQERYSQPLPPEDEIPF